MRRFDWKLFGIAAAAAWILPQGAFASTLTMNSVKFINVPGGLTETAVSALDHTLSGTTSTGWNVSAEVCVDGFCGGAAGPQSSAANPVLRLTNASFSCSDAGGCGIFDLGFNGFGGIVSVGTLTATVAVDGSVIGSGNHSIVFNGWDFSGGPNALVTFIIGQDGSFSVGPQTASTSALQSGLSMDGTIHINGALGPETLSLPGSFTITATNIAATPEPTTMALAGAALIGVGLIRRRRARP